MDTKAAPETTKRKRTGIAHHTKEEMIMKILDLVKGKKARFRFYRDGIFMYETEDGFQFPVPADDIGSATLFAEDKAILFMRWIRKQLECKNSASMQ